MVKVGDLEDQHGAGPHPVLWCNLCGAKFNANKGDYFMLPDDEELKCMGCKVPLKLVEVKEVITVLKE